VLPVWPWQVAEPAAFWPQAFYHHQRLLAKN